jgi:3-deoxy-D-manno-octulosonic-acid transferase
LPILLNLIYSLILVLISPWIIWRILVLKKNRRGWLQKLAGCVPIRNSKAPCIWIHAVSVGEVILLIPLVREIRDRFHQHEIVISTSTESGYDLAKTRFPDHSVFFCPADFSWSVKNTIGRIRPSLLILSELELWPNLIGITNGRKIPIAVINGRLSRRSFKGYKRMAWLSRHMVKKTNLFCVQTQRYADRFRELCADPDKVVVTGSIKFDSVRQRATEGRITQLKELAGITTNDVIWLAGSTQENEDLLVIQTFARLKDTYPELRLILVPRHPQRCDRLVKIAERENIDCQLRSSLTDAPVHGKPRLTIIDVIGELSDWWGCADIGYVGGSMGSRGGQNMIEPAAYGVPICFGPNTENFQSVVELLIADQAATVVVNQAEMQAFVAGCLAHPDSARQMGRRAQMTVNQQKGAASRTVDALRPLISAPAIDPVSDKLTDAA